MKNINKKIVWIILCMLLITTLLPVIGISKKNNIEKHRKVIANLEHLNYILNGDILYVGGSGPGNYSSIQAAIDNASSGDTVFVYDDSSPYYENIKLSKSLNLVGEQKNTTIIDGMKNNHVITIIVNYVAITGFTIQHSGHNYTDSGIIIYGNYSNISNNIIKNTGYGIFLSHTHNNTISRNIISDTDEDGIVLLYTNTSTIHQNTISNKYYYIGILSVYSHHNIISNNTISKTYHGIYLSATTYTNITENIVTSCRWKGLYLDNSPNNNITHNYLTLPLFSNSACDITLKQSPQSTITHNILYSGILIIQSYYNTINENIIKNKKLLYIENKTDTTITNDHGQIILINCNNITIKNQKISQTVRAIHLIHTNNCSLTQNTLTNNGYGIQNQYSNGTIITHNIIENNRKTGLYLDSSNSSTIINNTIQNNDDYGIYLNGNDNKIINNTIINNEYIGLRIIGINNIITNNTITYNGDGINILFLSNGLLEKNTVQYNKKHGIYLFDSSNNHITENICKDNQYGIYLDTSCNQHTVLHNDIQNNQYGLILDDAYHNTILKNNFINNKLDAFFKAFFHQAFYNSWSSNYWDGPRIIKIIWGTKTKIIFEHATISYP